MRSGPKALEQVGPLHPHLVLMDLAMEGMNGLEATRRLKAQENPPRVIILTLHDNPEYRAAAEQAHADGFVAKSDLGEKLLPLIHHLCPDQTGTTASPTSSLGQGVEQDESILGEGEQASDV